MLLADALPQLGFLFAADDDIEIAPEARAQLTPDSPRILDAALAALAALESFEAPAIEAALRAALVDDLDIKPRFAFTPLRVAVTGSKVSPPLFESLAVLGRPATLSRLERLRDSLAAHADGAG